MFHFGKTFETSRDCELEFQVSQQNIKFKYVLLKTLKMKTQLDDKVLSLMYYSQHEKCCIVIATESAIVSLSNYYMHACIWTEKK